MHGQKRFGSQEVNNYAIPGDSSRVHEKILGGVDSNGFIYGTHCDIESLELMAVTVLASLFSTFGTQVLISTALRTDGRCHRVVDCGTAERNPSDSQSFPVSCLRDASFFFMSRNIL